MAIVARARNVEWVRRLSTDQRLKLLLKAQDRPCGRLDGQCRITRQLRRYCMGDRSVHMPICIHLAARRCPNEAPASLCSVGTGVSDRSRTIARPQFDVVLNAESIRPSVCEHECEQRTIRKLYGNVYGVGCGKNVLTLDPGELVQVQKMVKPMTA